MNFFRRFYPFLVFAILTWLATSAGLPTSAQAGPDEEAFLAETVGQLLNEKWDSVFYEFSDLALKKYCPAQYEQIQDTLVQIYQENRRITLADLRSDREALLEGILGQCDQAHFVLGLEYQFNTYIALITGDLIERIEGLVFNSDLDLSLDSKKEMVERVVDAAMLHDYHPRKVLEALTRGDLELGEFRSDYLAHLPGTKVIGAGVSTSIGSLESQIVGPTSLTETDSAPVAEAKKPHKKGHCQVCRKKLGLMPFLCRCEGEFCATHRLPEEHSCSFDHHAAGKALLSKSLPAVSGDKLPDKI